MFSKFCKTHGTLKYTHTHTHTHTYTHTLKWDGRGEESVMRKKNPEFNLFCLLNWQCFVYNSCSNSL